MSKDDIGLQLRNMRLFLQYAEKMKESFERYVEFGGKHDKGFTDARYISWDRCGDIDTEIPTPIDLAEDFIDAAKDMINHLEAKLS